MHLCCYSGISVTVCVLQYFKQLPSPASQFKPIMLASIVLETELKANRKILRVNNPLIPDITPLLFCPAFSRRAIQNNARWAHCSKNAEINFHSQNEGCNNAPATSLRKLCILQYNDFSQLQGTA